MIFLFIVFILTHCINIQPLSSYILNITTSIAKQQSSRDATPYGDAITALYLKNHGYFIDIFIENHYTKYKISRNFLYNKIAKYTKYY